MRADRAVTSFEQSLEAELLASERRRTAILAGLFAVGAILAAASALLFRARELPALGARLPGTATAVAFLLMAGYESVVLRVLDRHRRSGALPPKALSYLNVIVEVSLPTVLLYMAAADYADPVLALSALPFYLYFLFVILAALRLDGRVPLFAGALAGVEYLWLAVHVVGDHGAASGLAPLMLTPFFYAQRALLLLVSGVTAGFVARELRRRLHETMATRDEREEVLRIFGQQTSPEVVEELVTGRADGQSRRARACVMFLDLRGFTTWAESREPEDVVAYLNQLFEFMIDIVNRHHGVIHQLLGDGFMAVFGVPVSHGNPAQSGFDAALEIVERVDREQQAGRIPATRVGIGLHAGEVVVGTVGSAIHKEYKVTGDTVNVAARIEQLNKRYASQLLVSEAVWRDVDPRGRVAVERGAVHVRGRSGSIGIRQLA